MLCCMCVYAVYSMLCVCLCCVCVCVCVCVFEDVFVHSSPLLTCSVSFLTGLASIESTSLSSDDKLSAHSKNRREV